MNEVYIVDAIRTPVGKLGGTLSAIRADDLAALVIKELMNRNPDINYEEVDEVILGCANQAGEDNRNVARMALLLAGLPHTVPGNTVNRLCASGMDAVINAARAIKAGDGDLYIAGGVENMSRAPFVMSKAEKAFSGNVEIFDTTLGWRFVNPKMRELYGVDSMGETAENLAEMYGITRDDQDLFAYNSQMKAAEATRSGRLAKEIVPVIIPRKKNDPLVFDKDEFIKPETTPAVLSKLRPAFRQGGTVTAGNSSGLNDGASALILASGDAVKKYGLTPRAKITGNAVAGVEPKIMGIGPVYAVQKLLTKTQAKIENFDVIELNEAFASQSLSVLRELGISDDDPRVNPNGGAIAIGHPLGMSGARLITTALNELEVKHKTRALCTLCVGVGQGVALSLECV